MVFAASRLLQMQILKSSYPFSCKQVEIYPFLQLQLTFLQAQPSKIRIKSQESVKYEEKLMAKAQVISDSANRLWRESNRKTCRRRWRHENSPSTAADDVHRNSDATRRLRGRITNIPEASVGWSGRHTLACTVAVAKLVHRTRAVGGGAHRLLPPFPQMRMHAATHPSIIGDEDAQPALHRTVAPPTTFRRLD